MNDPLPTAECPECQKPEYCLSWRQIVATALWPDGSMTKAVWLTAVCRRQYDALPLPSPPFSDDSASFSRPYNWAEVMSPSTTSSFAQRFRAGGEGETWRILLPPTSKNPSPFEEFASRVLGMTRIWGAYIIRSSIQMTGRRLHAIAQDEGEQKAPKKLITSCHAVSKVLCCE